MHPTLAVLILNHPEWSEWYAFLAHTLRETEIAIRDRQRARRAQIEREDTARAIPAYLRDWDAEERARTRRHGRRPARGGQERLC